MTPKKVKKPKPKTQESFDQEMELFDHLAELRTRIMRAIIAIAIGMAIVWVLYPHLWAFLMAPLRNIPEAKEWKPIFNNFMEPFFMQLQVCAIAGIIVSAPWWLMIEAWGFVKPALTRKERKAVNFVAPLCLILFFAGVATAIWVLPAGVRWFMSYLPNGVGLYQRVNDYVLFLVKLCLAFGIVFQLPVVVLFLAKVHLVDSKFLRKYWRQAVVVSSLVAAIVTPSNDAFTMTAMAVPVTGLYFLSILLVMMVEKADAKAAKQDAEDAGDGTPED